MCGTTDMIKETEWQQSLPDSPGEWLWLIQWSCGCVSCSGIAWVPERDETPDGLIELPSGLYLAWEGQEPPKPLNIDDIMAWRKINLPPREWCED